MRALAQNLGFRGVDDAEYGSWIEDNNTSLEEIITYWPRTPSRIGIVYLE